MHIYDLPMKTLVLPILQDNRFFEFDKNILELFLQGLFRDAQINLNAI